MVLEQPLSFWGGMDPHSGRVIDRRHPQAGIELAGRILVLPSGRGSSSSSTVLAEAIRTGTAPAAIVLKEPDAIIVLGAVVARELYGRVMPVVVANGPAYEDLKTGMYVTIEGATVTATPQ